MRLLMLMTGVGLFLLIPPALAQEVGTPVYQRSRHYAQQGRWGDHGTAYFGGGAYFAPPVVAGNWYARPYPYHFDYFRGRYSMPPMTPKECPCADVALPQ